MATDDGSVGEKGYNTLILERLITEAKSDDCQPIDGVYGCGPELMLKRISDICFEE